jgi:hypothetical protein
MNFLADLNVALELNLERKPWLRHSKAVWDACHSMRVTGPIAQSTPIEPPHG